MSQTTDGFKIIQDIMKLKWVPEILNSIDQEGTTYTEILNKVDYLSNTELNRKLAILVERKAIKKVEEEWHTRYYMLPFGNDLNHIFRHFQDIETKYAIM